MKALDSALRLLTLGALIFIGIQIGQLTHTLHMSALVVGSNDKPFIVSADASITGHVDTRSSLMGGVAVTSMPQLSIYWDQPMTLETSPLSPLDMRVNR